MHGLTLFSFLARRSCRDLGKTRTILPRRRCRGLPGIPIARGRAASGPRERRPGSTATNPFNIASTRYHGDEYCGNSVGYHSVLVLRFERCHENVSPSCSPHRGDGIEPAALAAGDEARVSQAPKRAREPQEHPAPLSGFRGNSLYLLGLKTPGSIPTPLRG